ncbi:glycosyltransferase family 39 protein [Methanobrevibacter sp.]|uniref:glycosyltransferase family 39 protein n=1 Tax=Methanobrevibacter sp. TaxID=66852 RepID=UPI00386B2A28
MNFNGLDLNREDWICLVIVIVFSFLCTLKMMLFTMSGCMLDPDIAIYLLSGLKYAGLDFFNVAYPEDLFYTPVISFLTSLFFRMGYVDKNAIIIVTAIFSFMGFVGLYCLLKNRFNSLLSLTGVIIFGSFSIVIFNISKGMVDIPLVSISIWVLIFAIMAIDKNPKYFLITFPLLAIAFFTKYTAGFLLPLILLYYCMKRNVVDKFDCLISDRTLFKQEFKGYLSSKELKYIILSLLLCLILAAIICKTLILDFGGSLTFFGQSIETFNGHSYSGIDFNSDKFYYIVMLRNMLYGPREIGIVVEALLYVIGLGLLIKGIRNFSVFKSERRQFKTKYLEKILIIFSVFLIFVSLFSFNDVSNHMVSNICLLVALTFIYSILQKFEFDDKLLSLDLLFLAYFLINFIFVSLYAIKAERYGLTFIPALVYFMIWGLEEIVESINVDKLSRFKLNKTIPIILIVIFLISTASFMAPIEYERTNDVVYALNYMGFKGDLVDACDFIINNDSDYHNESFASYYHHSRIIRWHLNVNLTILDEGDPNLADFNNTTYIILNDDVNLKNYHIIKNCGDFNVYHRN